MSRQEMHQAVDKDSIFSILDRLMAVDFQPQMSVSLEKTGPDEVWLMSKLQQALSQLQDMFSAIWHVETKSKRPLGVLAAKEVSIRGVK